MTTWTTTLTCSHCGREGPHELTYAGRILASTTCCACGHTMRHSADDLSTAYARDFAQRVLSKPSRMLRRLRRHPLRFLVSLPSAVVSKPCKLLDEVHPIIADEHTETVDPDRT